MYKKVLFLDPRGRIPEIQNSGKSQDTLCNFGNSEIRPEKTCFTDRCAAVPSDFGGKSGHFRFFSGNVTNLQKNAKCKKTQNAKRPENT
jgi:hypothetical protein